jgi:prolipoprotein diacylglyceryltransferase
MRSKAADPESFPRFFRIAGRPVNSYKVFLCVGCYAGILTSAWVGLASGLSPLALGFGLLGFALLGMLGARAYHLASHPRLYALSGFTLTARSGSEGGWSVLGGVIIVPISLLFDSVLGIPIAVFWDHMAIAIAVGGAFVRFGCVCNGCCVGRESTAWYALRQHDVNWDSKRRVPAQWLEIGWWVLAWLGLLWAWRIALPPGSYAFAVLGWYGLGRLWLENLRERITTVVGIRINLALAALMAVAGAAGLGLSILG